MRGTTTVTRARAARRIAARAAIGAAVGGGGAGLLGGLGLGLLATQAQLARRRIPAATLVPPQVDGRYGRFGARRDLTEPPLHMAMLGDSSAAGYGCERPEQTPAALLAQGLAEALGRQVELRSRAIVGARSSDLSAQVAALGDWHADIAVMMIGANDVTHRVRPSAAVASLEKVVRDLRSRGTQVVVGTGPDLGTITPVAQPLRAIARRWSRRLAAAQTIAVVAAGGRTVSLGDLLGPEFAAAPHVMFGPDRFHPSPDGYSAAAMALLPSACAAVGALPADFDAEATPHPERRPRNLPLVPGRLRRAGIRPVAVAAAQAAEEPGTEVAAVEVRGSDRGRRGPWARLRVLPRRRPADRAVAVADDLATPAPTDE
ncbi:MAG: SGNH/GDSL hydrolase family protein [Actinomycetes bacterium]